MDDGEYSHLRGDGRNDGGSQKCSHYQPFSAKIKPADGIRHHGAQNNIAQQGNRNNDEGIAEGLGQMRPFKHNPEILQIGEAFGQRKRSRRAKLAFILEGIDKNHIRRKYYYKDGRHQQKILDALQYRLLFHALFPLPVDDFALNAQNHNGYE
ncbi:hypothetical protein D3C81_1558410 [compost metagenome]